jgi:hypothetical protein
MATATDVPQGFSRSDVVARFETILDAIKTTTVDHQQSPQETKASSAFLHCSRAVDVFIVASAVEVCLRLASATSFLGQQSQICLQTFFSMGLPENNIYPNAALHISTTTHS